MVFSSSRHQHDHEERGKTAGGGRSSHGQSYDDTKTVRWRYMLTGPFLVFCLWQNLLVGRRVAVLSLSSIYNSVVVKNATTIINNETSYSSYASSKGDNALPSSINDQQELNVSLSNRMVADHHVMPNVTTAPRQEEQRRRRKMHVCHWRPHMGRPSEILKKEFGFEQVDATKGDEFDVIFGGYPHCGSKAWDWKMETGLNQKLKDTGFDKLQPHQVWFPCMGCANSFCDKRGLCQAQRQSDPSVCYLLPDNKEELLEKMKQSSDQQLWVLKRDAPHLHLHKGTGTKVIRSAQELPSDEEVKDGTYLVQPYADPFIGPGAYQRKSELKLDITITSIHPFRVYINSRPWVSLSGTLYANTTNETLSDQHHACIHDSHAYLSACQAFHSTVLAPKDSLLAFEDYATRVGIGPELRDKILSSATLILKNVFKNSMTIMENNEINKGIASSGASCFSFMRADFGIGVDGSTFLYEVNEFPFANQKFAAGKIQTEAYRDLFKMIGLADLPLLPHERAEYELLHRGGWEPLQLFND